MGLAVARARLWKTDDERTHVASLRATGKPGMHTPHAVRIVGFDDDREALLMHRQVDRVTVSMPRDAGGGTIEMTRRRNSFESRTPKFFRENDPQRQYRFIATVHMKDGSTKSLPFDIALPMSDG